MDRFFDKTRIAGFYFSRYCKDKSNIKYSLWREERAFQIISLSYAFKKRQLDRFERAVFSVGRSLYSVAFQLAVERCDTDVQKSRGFGFVAMRVLQHAKDMAALDLFEGQGIGRGAAFGSHAEFRRKAVGGQRIPISHNQAAFHYIAQFADVAMPCVAFEGLDIGLVDRLDALAHFRGELCGEKVDVAAYIARTFAQRGQVNMEHGQPEIKVLAEIAGGDLFFEVTVRGGDDTQIDLGW